MYGISLQNRENGVGSKLSNINNLINLSIGVSMEEKDDDFLCQTCYIKVDHIWQCWKFYDGGSCPSYEKSSQLENDIKFNDEE